METSITALRNKLSPFFNLANMVVVSGPNSKNLNKLIVEEAKKCLDNTDRIKMLIANIEAEMPKPPNPGNYHSVHGLYLEAVEDYLRSSKNIAETMRFAASHHALVGQVHPNEVENLWLAASHRIALPKFFCSQHVGFKLDGWIDEGGADTGAIEKQLNRIVVKEFSMNDQLPWVSWQEFGKHKNVTQWVLLDSMHAVGFNENVSIGYNYVIKKLPNRIFQILMGHFMTYNAYIDLKQSVIFDERNEMENGK